MGGESKAREKKRIKKGINILIGTPGRLLDHLQNTQCLDVTHLQFVVIDEADRLLDMGFERDVKQILNGLAEMSSRPVQTLLLSATLSHSVERLAGLSLKDPVRIYVTESSLQEAGGESSEGGPSETFATPDSLKHHLVVVPSKLRLVSLAAFVLWKTKYTSKNKKIVIFFSTQQSVEFHTHVLSSLEDEEGSLSLYKLHGDMPQKERTKVFLEFSAVESGVLLCTDVAARGLDLPNVRWIVQYDTPGSPRDYIHRAGRTARIGCQGHALLFLAPAEIEYAKVLQNYKISFNELQVDDILKTLLIESHNNPKLAASMRVHTVQESATQLQRRFEELVQTGTALRTLARKAYQSSVRAYATHAAEVKHIFHVRTLHLGHVAKSFALKDNPTNIGDIVSRTAGVAHTKDNKLKRKAFGMGGGSAPKKHRDVSEFSSGLATMTPLKTKASQHKSRTNSSNMEKTRNMYKSKPKHSKKFK